MVSNWVSESEIYTWLEWSMVADISYVAAMSAPVDHLARPKPYNEKSIWFISSFVTRLNVSLRLVQPLKLGRIGTECSQLTHGVESKDARSDDSCDIEAGENSRTAHSKGSEWEEPGSKTEEHAIGSHEAARYPAKRVNDRPPITLEQAVFITVTLNIEIVCPSFAIVAPIIAVIYLCQVVHIIDDNVLLADVG